MTDAGEQRMNGPAQEDLQEKGPLEEAREEASKSAEELVLAGEEYASLLSEAVGIPTISSFDPGMMDPEVFGKFEKFLKKRFPRVHAGCELERVSDYGLLYTWKGSNPDLKPVLFLAHYDVVPVDPREEGAWKYPPFSGTVAEGYIWGRGTLDDKHVLIALMTAVENMLTEGHTPERTLLFAFGGDEEVAGPRGAGAIGALLRERGIECEFALDEGGLIASGMLKGIEKPLALISLTEKGYYNIELICRQQPGHASMPPAHTAAGIIARAMTRVEKNPFPYRITPTVARFLQAIAPYSGFPAKLFLKYPKLFAPLITRSLRRNPRTAAIIRTTQAVTVLQGSSRENVLPETARGVINVRTLPGDTRESVLGHIKQAVNDPQVEVRVADSYAGNDALPEADSEGAGYRAILSTLRTVVPEADAAPFLMAGGSDLKHYVDVCPNMYRFIPVIITREELQGIHGINERISLENWGRCIYFYSRFIREVSGKSPGPGSG